MEDCIFCKIAKKEILTKLVYEDESFMAFLDNNPEVEGHTLVMPKKHFQTILELPSTMGVGLLNAIKKVSNSLINQGKADGFQLLVNNRKVAGQLVDHVHVHIIPRKKDDGVDLKVVGGLREKRASKKLGRFL